MGAVGVVFSAFSENGKNLGCFLFRAECCEFSKAAFERWDVNIFDFLLIEILGEVLRGQGRPR